MLKIITAVALATGVAFAQPFTTPATKTFVKVNGGVATKYTSKLKKLVVLNFSMGNAHTTGKISWKAIMNRLPNDYAVNGVQAFTIQNFESPNNGSAGPVPEFTAADLNSGDVIFANNISYFGTATMGATKQTAIQQAIETNGKGYFGVHGSGDNDKNGWPWYTNVLHPMLYAGHNARTSSPIYMHPAEKDHIILRGLFTTKTVIIPSAPDELDAAGNVKFATNIPGRSMLNEWYMFGRDISRDPTFGPRVKILMKYDGTKTGGQLPAQYIRKGGNMFAYLYKVGVGMTSYLPPGHDPDETTNTSNTFDQGTGDIYRYCMALLYFLAGYTTGPCDASCNGLPNVDVNDHYLGVYTSTGVILDSKNPAFYSTSDKAYEATIIDIKGQVVEKKNGVGKSSHEFDTSKYKPGVYFLRLRVGSEPVKSKRFMVVPST